MISKFRNRVLDVQPLMPKSVGARVPHATALRCIPIGHVFRWSGGNEMPLATYNTKMPPSQARRN